MHQVEIYAFQRLTEYIHSVRINLNIGNLYDFIFCDIETRSLYVKEYQRIFKFQFHERIGVYYSIMGINNINKSSSSLSFS